jgi:hypothetical protein
MGLEELADEVLEIHNHLLETKNLSDYILKFLIYSTSKNVDEQINALEKSSVEVL